MLKTIIRNLLLAVVLPIVALIIGILLHGCTSTLEQHARAKHRDCDVEVIDETRQAIEVRVKCKWSPEFTETIKAR